MRPGAWPPGAVVARRGRRQRQSGDPGRLLPVQFDQPVGRDAPVLQVRPDAQRDGEVRAGADQGADRVHVEVVVVVVGDHHHVDRAQGLQRDRVRVQPARADAGDRGAALAPDRVEQHPTALDLGQHRGVAQPGQPQSVGRRDGQFLRAQRVDRDRGGGLGVLLGQIGPEALQKGPRDHPSGRHRVLEGPVGEVRRALDPGEPLAGGLGAEGGRAERRRSQLGDAGVLGEAGVPGAGAGHGASSYGKPRDPPQPIQPPAGRPGFPGGPATDRGRRQA